MPFPALIDTHCHLTHQRLAGEVDDVVQRAQTAGVRQMISIGCGLSDGRATRDLARRFPGVVFATVGLDPFSGHEADADWQAHLRELEALLREGGFVGLGEIGLDYHYDYDPRPVQAQRCAAQLDLAKRLGLPVVIHVRDAHADMLALLAQHAPGRGVIHSFTGGPAEAEGYLALGWHLAFGGIATFSNAPEVRAAARLTPANRLLVETDAPFLAPVPLRGKRNEPAYVRHTLEMLARERGEDAESLSSLSFANSTRLFSLAG